MFGRLGLAHTSDQLPTLFGGLDPACVVKIVRNSWWWLYLEQESVRCFHLPIPLLAAVATWSFVTELLEDRVIGLTKIFEPFLKIVGKTLDMKFIIFLWFGSLKFLFILWTDLFKIFFCDNFRFSILNNEQTIGKSPFPMYMMHGDINYYPLFTIHPPWV